MIKDLDVVREIRSISDILFNRIHENLSRIPEGDGWIWEWHPDGIEDDCIEKYTIKTKDVVELVEFAVKFYEFYYHRNERELMDNPKYRSIVLTMVLSKVLEVVDVWRDGEVGVIEKDGELTVDNKFFKDIAKHITV